MAFFKNGMTESQIFHHKIYLCGTVEHSLEVLFGVSGHL